MGVNSWLLGNAGGFVYMLCKCFNERRKVLMIEMKGCGETKVKMSGDGRNRYPE